MRAHYANRTDSHSVVKALMSPFLKHAYVSKHILTDDGTVFVAELMKKLMETVGLKNFQATIKQGQTIDMIERSRAKLEKMLT